MYNFHLKKKKKTNSLRLSSEAGHRSFDVRTFEPFFLPEQNCNVTTEVREYVDGRGRQEVAARRIRGWNGGPRPARARQVRTTLMREILQSAHRRFSGRDEFG